MNAMDSQNFQRLQKEQEKAASKCKERIAEWERYKKEYETLYERIKTLPDKVSHDMMIPLGPLALVPGKLVHTNEITVLLGDNWFAERSSKQACEMIERKLKRCDIMLSTFRVEEENVKNWMGFTQDMANDAGELIDIREEYDEEEEALWKEQHQKNVRKYRQQLAQDKQNENNPTTSTHQLQVQSAPQSNYSLTESMSADGGSGDAGFIHNRGRRVSWQDQSATTIDNNDDDISDEEEQSCSLTINFSHTESSNTSNEKCPVTSDTIGTPADIYVKFAHLFQKTPKSILKRKGCNLSEKLQPPRNKTDVATPHKMQSIALSKVPIIQEHVIEHKPEETSATSSSSGRSTSRFKAQRELAQRKV